MNILAFIQQLLLCFYKLKMEIEIFVIEFKEYMLEGSTFRCLMFKTACIKFQNYFPFNYFLI